MRDEEIPFAYRRGGLVMFFNPLGREAEIDTGYDGDVVYKIGGAVIADGKVKLQPQSFLMMNTNP